MGITSPLQRSVIASTGFAAAAALIGLAKRRSFRGLIVASALLLFVNVADAQTRCLSITDHGGNGNGIADNTVAFNTTAALLAVNGGCIAFPPGTYLFNSALALSYPASVYAVTLLGAGADNTILYFPSSNGIAVTLQTAALNNQAIHVRNLTFATGDSSGGYSALTLSLPGCLSPFGESDIVDTTFRGVDGQAQKDYWALGVNVLGVSNINFEGDLFYGNSGGTGGTGISFAGPSGCGSADVVANSAQKRVHVVHQTGARLVNAANISRPGNKTAASPSASSSCSSGCSSSGGIPYGVVYAISQSGFFKLNVGVNYGTYIQGVTIAQSNFINDTTGIEVAAGAIGPTQLAVSGSVFNCTGANCTGYPVDVEAGVAAITMNGNLINVSPNGVGVNFHSGLGDQNSFINNVFAGSGTTATGTGILVSLPSEAISCPTPETIQEVIFYTNVMGNVFYNLATGVNLTDAIYWNVQANTYDTSVVTQVLNSNPSYAPYNKVGVISN